MTECFVGRAGWRRVAVAVAAITISAGGGTRAGAAPLSPRNAEGQVEIHLKDHRFVPAEIHVSAGHDHQLLIKNQDATADEFDSTALKVEKVIGGGRQGVVRLRELPPGRYPFMGEFHAETAQGVIVAE